MKTMLTMESVDDFVDEDGGDTSSLLGYTQAISDYDPVLKQMAENTSDLELKTKLLEFCDQQNKFKTEALKKYGFIK